MLAPDAGEKPLAKPEKHYAQIKDHTPKGHGDTQQPGIRAGLNTHTIANRPTHDLIVSECHSSQIDSDRQAGQGEYR